MRIRRLALLAAIAVSSACSRSDAHQSEVVDRDTLLTTDESLRRFRASLHVVSHLSPAFASREEVAREFVAAVATRDTNRLARLLLTPAEYAWLYYPENPLSRAPYELPAGLAWFELHTNSSAGLRRVLAEYGGQSMTFRRLVCAERVVEHGANRLWNRCVVGISTANNATADVRMFGTILEREGVFKLLTAANDL